MTWLTWVVLIGTLVGIFWVWYQVYGRKNDIVSCCGCGQCAFSGECVMVKKKAVEKPKDLP